MSERDNKFVLREMESIDEVIGNPPGWLLRSGITIVAVIVAVLLSLASLIRYPDKITSKGVLTSDLPPVVHFSKSSGTIEKLFVANGMQVRQGDSLAYIKNTMNLDHLQQVKEYLNQTKAAIKSNNLLRIRQPKNLNLGNLTSSYNSLKSSIEALQLTLRQHEVYVQIKTLKEEISETKNLQDILLKDKEFTRQEMDLTVKGFERTLVLNEEGVISDIEREAKEANLIRNQKNFNGLDKGIIQNRIRLKQLTLEVQRLQESRSSRITTHLSQINEQISLLDEGIRGWKKNFFVYAESDGVVELRTEITEDVQVSPVTPLLTIIKNNESDSNYAKLICSSTGFGKIHKNQRVIIKVEAFPYKEFGVLEGAIDEIARLPQTDSEGAGVYELRVYLDANLITSYGQEIPFTQEATIEGEVITEDLTLLSRIFSQFRSLIKNA